MFKQESIIRNRITNVGYAEKEMKQVSECSKPAPKEYKSRHDWVGKVIYWGLCKGLKFDYIAKCYIHKPESILENEIHKVLWNFEIFQ